jgi:hypothetical protein
MVRTAILFQLKIWPHIRATVATSCADEPRLNVGQPDIIRPVVAADGDRMTAIVRAIDQQTVRALGAHVGEGAKVAQNHWAYES